MAPQATSEYGSLPASQIEGVGSKQHPKTFPQDAHLPLNSTMDAAKFLSHLRRACDRFSTTAGRKAKSAQSQA